MVTPHVITTIRGVITRLFRALAISLALGVPFDAIAFDPRATVGKRPFAALSFRLARKAIFISQEGQRTTEAVCSYSHTILTFNSIRSDSHVHLISSKRQGIISGCGSGKVFHCCLRVFCLHLHNNNKSTRWVFNRLVHDMCTDAIAASQAYIEESSSYLGNFRSTVLLGVGTVGDQGQGRCNKKEEELHGCRLMGYVCLLLLQIQFQNYEHYHWCN